MSFRIPDDARARRADLLRWFADHARDLPWRATRDPYRVWISEAMLQQTRVEAVRGHYARFVDALPDLASLAAASEDEVLALWSGLGYYSRARKLREAAIAIARDHGGAFPRERDAALALPGVGPYTAGAVLSIAHGEAVPLVDGNVERVLCRWFGWGGDPKRGATKRALWSAAEELLDGLDDAGAWNQAVMELGALVCTPRAPVCAECPLRDGCVALREGRVDALPELAKRARPIEVELEVALCRDGDAWLFERRPADGRMAGMYEFPTREVAETPRLWPTRFAAGGLVLEERVGSVRHSITKHRITAHAFRAALPSGAADEAGSEGALQRVRDAELDGLALTGMTRKLLRAAFVRT